MSDKPLSDADFKSPVKVQSGEMIGNTATKAERSIKTIALK
jgi:hypothetical protein